MKKMWSFWREASVDMLAGITGFFIGVLIHNQFFKEFTLVGIDSLNIVGFLFALIAIIAVEIYRNRK